MIEKEADLAVCGEAGTAVAAREMVMRLHPDVAVVDLMLADEDGLTLVQELRGLYPALRVVVVPMLDEAVYAERARKVGAEAYFNKTTGLSALGPVLQRLVSSRRNDSLTKAVKGPVPVEKASLGGIEDLSNRELQVFQLIGLGRPSRDIAAALGVSVKTVESHRENIKIKLGVASSVQLVGKAALWVRDQGMAR